VIKHLITQGDYVAIENGLLVIKPASGKPVPTDWLKSEGDALIAQILDCTDTPAYRYTHHTTAVEPKYSSDRLTLWFRSASTDSNVLIHFNVDLTRKRNSSKHQAGGKLPKSKFIPRKHSKFVQWWQRLNLTKPRYLSEYHEKLHLLKPPLFTGTTELAKNHQVRFQDKKIELLSVTYEDIKFSVTRRDLIGNSSVNHRELIGTGHRVGITGPPVNATATDDSEYVSDLVRLKNSTIGATYKGTVSTPPEQQTTDEWLAAYKSTV